MDRLAQFANLIDGWFWETDNAHRFVYMSPSVEKYSGYTPEWHYGKCRTDWRAEGVDEEVWQAHLNSLKNQHPFYDFVFSRKGPDGIRWMSTSGEPFFSSQGVFSGYRGVARDITAKINLSKEAERSKEQLLNALEIIDEGFVYYDSDGRLVTCNEKYRDYYPKSRHLMVPGAKFEDIIRAGAQAGQHTAALGRVEEWVAERMAAHQKADTQIEQQLTDGRWLRITERRMPDGGVVGMRVDVTDIKSAQEDAEAASLAKSNFLSTMSHEIRTPLNGILGLSQLLKGTDLDADQERKVDTILSSGNTLLVIINDVLDMSKIEAGGLELEETVFSLRDLISTIATPFQSLATDKNLKLRVTSDVSADEMLKGDPVRLRQILWNLLSNAIKFTDRGMITLSIRAVDPIDPHISNPKDSLLIFSVEDTGHGIAPNRLSSIFEAFTQEDNSITRRFGGTGLGLSIVKQLTDLMDGAIEVDSQVDKGTVFTVYLPFYKATEEEVYSFSMASQIKHLNDTKPLKVLLAEDNPVNTMIAKAFLEKMGHQVRHAENGKQAVEIVSEGWPDLVLMDIHMPVMDGIEATQSIRKSGVSETLPIVGLTAEAFAERHALFKKAGMDEVLTKPFTEKQLADVLTEYGHKATVLKKQKAPVGHGSLQRQSEQKIKAQRPDDPAYLSLPIGDDEKLESLGEQVSNEVLLTLLAQAEESLRSRREDLTGGISTENPALVREAAHSLKGSAGSLFAVQLASLVEHIEKNADDFVLLQELKPVLHKTSEETLEWWKSKT